MVGGLDLIEYHFQLTSVQREQFRGLVQQHQQLAHQLNLVSAGDLEHLWIRHVLHSLALAKVISMQNVQTMLDIGTGGGFPALPMAILFPRIEITAIDGRSRKTRALLQIIESIGCRNVVVLDKRAENLHGAFDLITARAVAPLHKLVKWSGRLALPKSRLLFFKGGDYHHELDLLRKHTTIEHSLVERFKQPYFSQKYLVEVMAARASSS